MKRAIKVVVWFFAAVGLAYCAFVLYAYLFAFPCKFAIAAQAISPNGQYVAVFEQRVCKDLAKSWSEVLLGKRGQKNRAVLLEVRGTSQVTLSWSTDDELVVSYPRGAVVKMYQAMRDGWPRATFRETDQ